MNPGVVYHSQGRLVASIMFCHGDTKHAVTSAVSRIEAVPSRHSLSGEGCDTQEVLFSWHSGRNKFRPHQSPDFDTSFCTGGCRRERERGSRSSANILQLSPFIQNAHLASRSVSIVQSVVLSLVILYSPSSELEWIPRTSRTAYSLDF